LLQDLKGWYEYLAKYENTICGRHPISVFLQVCSPLRSIHKRFAVLAQPSTESSFVTDLVYQAAKLCKSKFSVRMVQYRQSSKVQSDEDSSVSYVAAIASVK